MNKKRRKNKKQTPVKKDPRDKKAERITYIVLIILILASVVIGFKMSKDVAAGAIMHEENYSKEIEN